MKVNGLKKIDVFSIFLMYCNRCYVYLTLPKQFFFTEYFSTKSLFIVIKIIQAHNYNLMHSNMDFISMAITQ